MKREVWEKKADASGAMNRTVRITDHTFKIVEDYYQSIQPFENKVLLAVFSRILSENPCDRNSCEGSGL